MKKKKIAKHCANDAYNDGNCPPLIAYMQHMVMMSSLTWLQVPKAGSTSWVENFLILADVDPAALDQGMKVYRSAPRLNTSFRDLNCKLYYAAWFLLHPLP